ncbi:hypothetical protein MTAT_19960 [Moorella thermoacetica]|uniref:Uncharacterized protein n=1 Tax=Neomoorella thermoacetica TaxID=1525 RepID=A0AAC9HKA1_NEOTH|nr:hypothetical protein Maut_02223 [Moorella thermoacetica]TYL12754.1 hypothetical protein MTAT_19960 [Moorella thermoacetica]
MKRLFILPIELVYGWKMVLYVVVVKCVLVARGLMNAKKYY